MKRAELHRKIRKSHRYLGVALGIEFLFLIKQERSLRVFWSHSYK